MAFIPHRTYSIAVTGTASTPLSIGEYYPSGALAGRELQAQIYAKGCDMIYVFADASTSASVTLADLAANGAFASDTLWTKGTGWTIAAGVATATGAISTTLSQFANLVPGRTYTVVYDGTRSAGTVTVSVGGTAGTARSTSATFTENIVAGSDGTITFTGAAFTGTVDNVTVKETCYPLGNNLVPVSTMVINQGTSKFISAMSQDASSTGTLFLTTGYNERS